MQSIFLDRGRWCLKDILKWMKKRLIDYRDGPIVMKDYYKFIIRVCDFDKDIVIKTQY